MGLLSFLFGGSDDAFNMTKDYIGKHGEFDRSDADRAACEDMFQMKSCDRDADIESHFGWENNLNYESDGYSDGDDW